MTKHIDPHRDRDIWSQYLDGDLEAAERQELESHLRECEICRGEIDMLKKTVALIGQLQDLQAPDDFAVKLNQRLRRQRHKRRKSRRQFSIYSHNFTTILIIATLLVISFFMLYLIKIYM
jgi:anti-sigma factor RsiW